MTKVSVVILNWNRAKDTIECLRSVNRARVKGIELSILVVDNHSTDDSVDRIGQQTSNIKHLQIIRNNSNLGFAEGNNVGIKKALNDGANYVLVLNNDTLVDRDMIMELVKVFDNDSSACAVSPKIYFAPGFEFHKDRYSKRNLGRVVWYAGGKMDWNNIYGSNMGVDEVDRGQFDKLTETDFATGACTMFRASALKQIGLYSEQYFMYSEDLELSQRMKNEGLKVMYAPKAVMWHKVAQSSAIGGQLNDYFTTRNRLIFADKYASMRTKFALFRENIRLLLFGREWQKIGIRDYYLGRFGKGSWK